MPTIIQIFLNDWKEDLGKNLPIFRRCLEKPGVAIITQFAEKIPAFTILEQRSFSY